MHAGSLPVICFLFAQFAPVQPAASPPPLPPVTPITATQSAAPQGAAPAPTSNRQFEPAVRLGEPTPAKKPAAAFQLRDDTPATVIDDRATGGANDSIQLAPLRPAGAPSFAPAILSQKTLPQQPSATLTGPVHADVVQQVRSLAGKPLSLPAALERVSDNAGQLKAVKAYWLLSAAQSEYEQALDEEFFLTTVSPPRSAHEQARLRAAQAAAESRAKQAELTAIAAQQDLADAALLPTADGLPLSKDEPLVGAYRTNFETIFANRPVPAGLRRIDRTLPHYVTLIAARASSVAAAQQSLDAMHRAYQTGEVDLRDVLEAFGHMRQQRREHLAAVRDYNLSIAEYALNAAGPGLSREKVVAMLIPSAARDKSVLVPRREVQPASAEQSVPAGSQKEPRDGAATSSPFRDVTPGRLVPVEPKLVPNSFNP